MPLHLLGKKSWNVYNPENVARVRQDEAAAKAQDEKNERDRRDVAAARRLQTLRGEETSDTSPDIVPKSKSHDITEESRDSRRKKRRLIGEDDTDRDIRLAKADVDTISAVHRDATIFDRKGHISLVPNSKTRQDGQAEPQPQAEVGGMRFKDAAGYNANGDPWYSSKSSSKTAGLSEGKDVWGNEDPRRREREQQRMSANDPLMAMKKGVKQLRENERQRQEWIEQRHRDLYEVEKLARAARRRRRASSEEDSLDGFSLDAPSRRPQDIEERRERNRRHHWHRHRSKSPKKEHRHHHRRRRYSEKA